MKNCSYSAAFSDWDQKLDGIYLIGETDADTTKLIVNEENQAFRELQRNSHPTRPQAKLKKRYAHMFRPSLSNSEHGTSQLQKVGCGTGFQGEDRDLQPQHPIIHLLIKIIKLMLGGLREESSWR